MSRVRLYALNATWIQVIEKQLLSGTASRIRSHENVVRKYYYETDSRKTLHGRYSVWIKATNFVLVGTPLLEYNFPNTHKFTWPTVLMVKVKVKWSRYRPGVAQRVGRGIALLFHGRGTRRRWVVSSTPRPHFTPGKDPVPILQEAGWAPGLV